MLWAALSAQGSWALVAYGLGATVILVVSILQSLRQFSQEDALAAELTKVQSHCAQLQQQLQAAAAENTTLRAQQDHWQQQYDALSQQLTALEATYQQLEANLHRLEQERDRLQQALEQPPDWWQEITKNDGDILPFLPHEDTGSKS